jgi:hypothetical protein
MSECGWWIAADYQKALLAGYRRARIGPGPTQVLQANTNRRLQR